MAGARKKPAKKKMVRGPKQATMRQAPPGTRTEYRRRSAALAKRHGWTDAERKRWENRQWHVDYKARRLADHADDADRYPTLAAQDKAAWRGGARSYDPYSRRAAVGEAINPTERTRREALARQKKEAAKKKATRAKKVASAKKAAPKRSPAKKRAAPLKRRSYR